MRLEDLRVELRPRSPWEAVDLGLVLVRAWRGPLYSPWLATLLPAAAAALWLLGPLRGVLLLWWLKPLFDRLALDVLSRSVFGETPRTGESLRRLPRLATGWLLDALLLHRLDPARCFRLPTWQLEGLRGSRRRARARVLDPGSVGTAVGLTLTGLALELGTTAALLVLPALLTPGWVDLDWGQAWELWTKGQGAAWLGWLVAGAWVLAVALLEPFQVAAGFALYLNRRTQLEGWDLEIAFRRLATRVRAADERRRGERGAGRSAALLLGLALLLPAAVSRAQEAGPAEAAAASPLESEAERAVERILATPEFDREASVRRWRLSERLTDWLEGLFEREVPTGSFTAGALFARLAEAVLWVATILFGIWLIVLGLRRAGLLLPRRRKKKDASPRFVAGLDISPESLPDDPAAEARRLWAEGRRTQALGLLYRASLARLVDRHGLDLRESFTERDCLAAASGRLTPEAAGHFRELTLGWQAAAYAHRTPPEESGEGLFVAWTRHFGEAA